MNEYLKNNNVIVKDLIMLDYLERNSHVAKIVWGTSFDNDGC